MIKDVISTDLDYIVSQLGNTDKFKNGSVLITGCAGFLGFYITQTLVKNAAALGIKSVIGLDIFLHGHPEWLEELTQLHGDILSVQKFDIAKDDISTIDGAKTVTHVIHAASIASPIFYRRHPVITMEANVWGLKHLLDFYKKSNSLRGFLFFSSSEIYGDPDPASIPTNEEYHGNVSCHGPRACYDESKRFGETMCWVYSTEFDLPITVVRPFNNYGPGMSINDKRLPADLANDVLNNRDIVLLSDGSPTRTFCYVADAVVGYFKCLLHGKYDYFNIGNDKPEIMVREFAEIVSQQAKTLFGYDGKIVYQKSDDENYMKDNPDRRCPDLSKAREILDFNPQISTEDGVSRYLSYLRRNS